MSIQKKSLISTLKSAKKANVVKEDVTVSGTTASPMKRTPRFSAPVKKARVAGPSKRTRVAGPSKRTRGIAPRQIV